MFSMTKRLIFSVLAAVVFLLPSAVILADEPGAEKWQSHASIERSAEAAVAEHLRGSPGTHQIVASPLDARVRLASCGQVLEGSVPFAKGRAGSRMTTLVRCAGPEPWKIYVPVRLTVVRPVVVAARALPRGTILTDADVMLADQDVQAMGYGHLEAPEHAVGHRLRRSLAAGDALRPSLLETPPVVRRGQRLTLEANNAGLTVRMAGIAKSDGVIGAVIDVENVSSRRQLQAIVRSPQRAEVLLR